MVWKLYSDGASRGNPGVSGAGALLIDPDGNEIPLTLFLGHKTNNQAEYEALLLGLRELQNRGAKEVEVFADSELMIRQLNGVYKVKNENMIPLFKMAQELLRSFPKYTCKHIPREQNTKADALSNLAIDERK